MLRPGLLLILLVACGGTSPAPQPAAPPPSEAEVPQPPEVVQTGDPAEQEALLCLEECSDELGMDGERYCHEQCGLEGGENSPCVDRCLATDASDPARCVRHCSAEEHGLPICFVDCIHAGGENDACSAECGLD